MFIIDETYFTGEISIPNLPTSRIGETFADFGMAKMMQTVGENNLLVFVDSKTTEYLRIFFGEAFASKLEEAWFDYVECTEYIETELAVIDNDTPRNTWITLPDVAVDITFSEFKVNDEVPTKEKTFGKFKRLTFMDGQVEIRVSRDETFEYRVKSGVDFNEPITVKERHKTDTPSDVIRRLINQLIGHDGSNKVSPIANYVWFHVNRDAANGTTTMGEADLNFSRASNAYEADKRIKLNSMRNKQIRAWNGMVAQNLQLIAYVTHNIAELRAEGVNLSRARELLSTINSFNM